MLVFGFGSLVNTETIPFPIATYPAVLHGWVRQWRDYRRTEQGEICGLTLEQREGVSIEGLLIEGDGQFRKYIHGREAQEIDVKVTVERSDGHVEEAYVFVTDASNRIWASASCPICLSYVECVLQGYLRMFGSDGVARFMATTEGWQLPFLDDSGVPRYPRSKLLSPAERQTIKQHLALFGIIGLSY